MERLGNDYLSQSFKDSYSNQRLNLQSMQRLKMQTRLRIAKRYNQQPYASMMKQTYNSKFNGQIKSIEQIRDSSNREEPKQNTQVVENKATLKSPMIVSNSVSPNRVSIYSDRDKCDPTHQPLPQTQMLIFGICNLSNPSN